LNNAKNALSIAEQFINIPQDLIDAQELVEGQISEKQMVLYLTLFYNAFSDKDNSMSRESIISRIRDLEKNLQVNTNDRDHVLGVTNDLEQKKTYLTQTITTTKEERDHLSSWKKQKEEEWKIAREEMLKKK